MPTSQPNHNNLAEPFSQIFTDRAEANWAFDLLRDAVRQLRVNGAYDTRMAVTILRRTSRPCLRLNFGGWLVLGFRGAGQLPERVDVALLADFVAWDERFDSFSFDRKEGEPEVRSYALPLSMLRPMTSDVRHAFESTLNFIAAKFQHWKRATHWKQHNPEIVEALFDPERRARLFFAGLTDPELRYERHFTAFSRELAEEGGGFSTYSGRNKLILDTDKLEELLSLIRLKYPDWPDFFDLDFRRDEVDYKQATVTKARELLAESELVQLINADDFDEVIDRLDKIGKDNNLLWRNMPQSGDLNILYQDDLDKPTFCNALFDLLYGPGESPERLGRYSDYVASTQFQNKWPFSTYFLFVCHPETEMFVKPKTTRWFLEYWGIQYTSKPGAAAYALVKQLSTQLKNALVEYGVQDMVDVQSLIWVAYRGKTNVNISVENEKNQQLAEPFLLPQPVFPLPQLAEETGLSEADLNRWVRAIQRKGQAVFYGPPGTGKTFIAKKLAAHLVGGGNGFTELVQFHPAYAYEDFVQGIRPESKGSVLTYPLVPGRFLEFCRRAEGRDTCVLIIDEINRANLACVFGELMYLLEYRSQHIKLAGSSERFQISANVRLIGTMNTADRSIALVDHALRRRFAFIALHPDFDVLRHYHQREQTGFSVEGLISVLKRLNGEIGDSHYVVGITFFLQKNLADDIADIWQMEIEPYLAEYFFDQREKSAIFKWENVMQEILAL